MNEKYCICMILLIVSIFFNVCGCDSGKAEIAKEVEKDKTEEEIEREDAVEMVTYYRKIIALLSFKYDIPDEMMKQLLIDYIQNDNRLWLFTGEEKPTNDYTMVLEKLSIQHNIPKAKLGSIIIDYKLLIKE